MPEFGEPLSKREKEILECVASGAGNKQIAAELYISQNTVKVHLRNVYIKLGVSSRTEATTEAFRLGLVKVPGSEDTAVADPEPIPLNTIEIEAQPPSSGNDQTSETIFESDTLNKGADSSSAKRKPWALIVIGFVALILVILAIVMGINYFIAPTQATPSPPFAETAIGDNWVQSRPIPVTSAKSAVASFGLDLYLIGGEQDGTVSHDVLLYDTVNLLWENKAQKPTAVSEATATELGGVIFVPGGRTIAGNPTEIVEVYSPANDAWGTVTSLPKAIAGALTLTDGGRIYVIGGTDDSDMLDTVYVYDPGADSWRPLTNMAHARLFASGGVIGNKLYVIGGFGGQSELDVCEVYDIVDDSWDVCSPLLTPRGGAGTAVLVNKLYIVGGGMDANNPISSSEVYDPTIDEWSLINTPIFAEDTKLLHASISSVENRIYTLGGIRSNDAATNDNFAYAPLIYQTFIPAASSDSNK